MKTVIHLFAVLALLSSVPAIAADSLYGNRIKRWTTQAEKGKARYQYKLGNAYLMGNEVVKNEKTAAEWFRKAAKQGYTKAQHKLGYLYYTGQGVRRNYKLAFQWLSKAAHANYSPAQYHLGKLYAEGKGVDQDLDKALRWFEQAARAGYVPAKAEIRKLKELIARSRKAEPPVTRKPAARPKPKPRPRRPATRSKPNFTRLLLDGNWTLDRKPAEHMPSHITKCKRDGSSIVCKSLQLQRFTNAAEVTYQVETTIAEPDGDGSFLASYRVNNIFVLPEDADDPNPKGDIPATGWGKSVLLRCKFRDSRTIDCTNSRSGKKERYTLRKKR